MNGRIFFYVIVYIGMLVDLRFFISGIISYVLSPSAYKKRKRNTTIKEWFLLSKYRDILPCWLLKLYFGLQILAITNVAVSVPLFFLNNSKIAFIALALFPTVYIIQYIYFRIRCWNSNAVRRWDYSKIVDKKQQKKQR